MLKFLIPTSLFLEKSSERNATQHRVCGIRRKTERKEHSQ